MTDGIKEEPIWLDEGLRFVAHLASEDDVARIKGWIQTAAEAGDDDQVWAIVSNPPAYAGARLGPCAAKGRVPNHGDSTSFAARRSHDQQLHEALRPTIVANPARMPSSGLFIVSETAVAS